MSDPEDPPPPLLPAFDRLSTASSMMSSLPSISGDGEEGGGESYSSALWPTSTGGSINWHERCLDLQMSLHKFRVQATKIRDVLKDKLAELEKKIEHAEKRAEIAERKAWLMEQRLLATGKSGEQRFDSTNATSNPDFSPIHHTCNEKDSVICSLEKQVEEQKKLRISDAKQVEDKAAKIKEWVTNKLKELEEQNQHLREQNQKCNVQLELLKNRLTQLSQLSIKQKPRDRASTEDSSRGSFEDRGESDDSLPPEISDGLAPITYPVRRKHSLGEDNTSLLPHSTLSRKSSSFRESDSYPLYAAVDYSKKKSHTRSAPPRVKLERKKYREYHNSLTSSTSEPCDSEMDSWHGSRADSGSVDVDTPSLVTPKSPLTPNAPCAILVPQLSTTEPCLPFRQMSLEDDKSRSLSPSQIKCFCGSQAIDTAKNILPESALRKAVSTLHAKFESNKWNEGRNTIIGSESPQSASPECQQAVFHHMSSHRNAIKNNVFCDGTCQSLDRKLSSHKNLQLDNLTSSGCASVCKSTISTEDEIHDYAEIYTPSTESRVFEDQRTCLEKEIERKPPTPPLHRFPSWESRIYEVAVNGINVTCESIHGIQTSSPNNNSKTPNDHYSNAAFTVLNIPVYATVKGRASQIRSMPFTGESSDSSDNEDTRVTVTTISSHTTSGDTESSLSAGSPGKKGTPVSPLPSKQSCSSPIKSVRRDTSVESVLSDDYAIPPDALSVDTVSIDSMEPLVVQIQHMEETPKREPLEKCGYLTKLGGKFKTWRRRWFVLKNGSLSYFKSQNDVNRKQQGQIILDDVCRVNRAEGAATFEISTGKRTYYLTADSINLMDEWIKVLENVLLRNATRLLLTKEDNKPTAEGWLTKVKHGHSRRCWCVLIGRMFLYFKTPNDSTPIGQINMRDARVEEVIHVSDSDEEDQDGNVSKSEYTVGIFPNHQGPTYLLMANKQEMDTWMYHLTVVSSGDNLVGTQYEQFIAKLMEVDGDENSMVWKHPTLLYNKDNIPQPLTTLPSEQLQTEAVKLFKSIQLFISVPLDTSGIDYHVALAQNALQQCLILPELQNELFCQLIKQTSRHCHQKLGVQQLLLCATQSLFLCDTSSSEKTSPTSVGSIDKNPPVDSKLNPAPYVFVQAWQLLALAVSLFIPKNRTLWYLRAHLQRNSDSKFESGKYAIFCQRALERGLINGVRECKPSRMEVLSILLKNPYHHSLPHSIPVHFVNGTYQVFGFDGSTTIEEFMRTVNTEMGIRDTSQSGFALFSDDPIEKSLEHCLQNSSKLCDVISQWEQALREKHLGKFENTKVLRLIYKNRLCLRQMLKAETDRERLLTAYQVNEDVVQGKFPFTKQLALELAALLSQIEFGDYNDDKFRSSGVPPGNAQQHLQQALERFFPKRYRDIKDDKHNLELIREKWLLLKGRSVIDCVRIYLNCSRKWSYCGGKLFSAKLKTGDQQTLWLAVTEDSIALLDTNTMQCLKRYSYANVMTFGGCKDDFMLVVSCQEPDGVRDGISPTEHLLFVMSKPKILELTLLIADYMNALGRSPSAPPSPQGSTLSRLEKIRAKIRGTIATTCTSGSSITRHHINSSCTVDSSDITKLVSETESRILHKFDSKKRSDCT